MRSTTKFLSLAVVGVTILGFAFLVGGLASPANAGEVPLPHVAKAFKGTQCVEPVDVMRRNHMNFLTHQRDETLREGIRGQKYSLNECIDCHAVASPDVAGGKVRTLKPFCAECHTYAAVSLDCFECHTGAAVMGIGSSAVHPNVQTETNEPAQMGGSAQ